MYKMQGSVFSLVFALLIQAAAGAHFTYNLVDDTFQQLWSNPIYWTLESGVDDGGNGYPDGTDTFSMDRSPTTSTSTRLAIEGGPPFDVAGITGKGGNQRDVVLKFGDFTLGDLEVLPSAQTFLIQSERDRDFTINGVISGAGDLVLERAGGFSDGVDPDELITITGAAPNTITGTIRLYNSNGGGQPSYWVADKVGAFGQTPELTLEGRAGLSGVASLRITINAVGGEGAIDDDATALYIGAEGLLSIDSGVDEKIGAGKLFIDLSGSETYTEVPVGTYDNTEDWIIGDGTVTVGEPNLFVTTLADVVDGSDGLTSLREAVTFANSNADQSDITFSSALEDGTITLDPVLGQIELTTAISIDGDIDGDNKADITISGGDATRIFGVSGGSADATLRSLTIAEGNSSNTPGGAIYHTGGELLIIDTSLLDNDSGTSRGGAIASADAVRIELQNALLAGNSTKQAGAANIQNTVTSVLKNVTMTGNTASNSGALLAYSTSNDMDVTIANSTVADNLAGTIRFVGGNGLTITAALSNTIFATADNNGSVNESPNGGTLNVTADYCFYQSGLLAGTGNILSASDPGLAPLADNGGVTQTMAPIPGSVLVDAGDPAFDPNAFTPALTTDQRGTGYDRVIQGLASSPSARVDIGAFELVNDFATWVSGFFSDPGDITFDADPDLDGIGNALENFLGTAPDEFSQGLVVSTAAPGIFTASHSQSNSPAIDVLTEYEWSSDLATWQPSGDTDPNGVTVTIASLVTDDQVAPANDTVEVTATVTGGSTNRLFLRLRAPEPGP